jgi:hypothetical protein
MSQADYSIACLQSPSEARFHCYPRAVSVPSRGLRAGPMRRSALDGEIENFGRIIARSACSYPARPGGADLGQAVCAVSSFRIANMPDQPHIGGHGGVPKWGGADSARVTVGSGPCRGRGRCFGSRRDDAPSGSQDGSQPAQEPGRNRRRWAIIAAGQIPPGDREPLRATGRACMACKRSGVRIPVAPLPSSE